MICKNCNTEFKEGTFCPKCGVRVGAESAVRKKNRKGIRLLVLLLFVVVALLIYVIVQPPSDTTPTNDAIIKNSEVISESDVVIQEELQKDNEDLKEYEDKLNSYEMVIFIYENDVYMEKYELDTDIYIDGERYSNPTFSDYIIIKPVLEVGTHEIWLTKTTGNKEKDSNKIKFEVSPMYTNEIEIEATLKNKKEFSLKTVVENDEIFEGSESELYKDVEIVRTSNGKEIYYTVEFYVDNTQFINNTSVNRMAWITTEKVARGDEAIAPEPPSYEHYEFVGWSEDISDVKSNLTVFAQYELKEEDCLPEYIGEYEYKTTNWIDGGEYVCILNVTRVTDVGIYFSFNFIDTESHKEILLKDEFAPWYSVGDNASWYYKENGKEYSLKFKFYDYEGELAMMLIDGMGNTNAEVQLGERYKKVK